MIPSVVARQTRETVLDYMRATFSLTNTDFERALFEFLDGDGGLFKGPYVDIRLPFRKGGVLSGLSLSPPPKQRAPSMSLGPASVWGNY